MFIIVHVTARRSASALWRRNALALLPFARRRLTGRVAPQTAPSRRCFICVLLHCDQLASDRTDGYSSTYRYLARFLQSNDRVKSQSSRAKTGIVNHRFSTMFSKHLFSDAPIEVFVLITRRVFISKCVLDIYAEVRIRLTRARGSMFIIITRRA